MGNYVFWQYVPHPPPQTKLVLLCLIYPSQSIYGGGVRVKTQSSCPFWKIPKEAATFVSVNKYYNLFSLFKSQQNSVFFLSKNLNNPPPSQLKTPPPSKKKTRCATTEKRVHNSHKNTYIHHFIEGKTQTIPTKQTSFILNKKQKEKKTTVCLWKLFGS